MTCNGLVADLADYLLGALSLMRNREIESHLRGCPECVALLNTYKVTSSLGQDIPTKRPSADFQAQLISSIAERIKQGTPLTFPSLLISDEPSSTFQLLSKES